MQTVRYRPLTLSFQALQPIWKKEMAGWNTANLLPHDGVEAADFNMAFGQTLRDTNHYGDLLCRYFAYVNLSCRATKA